VTTAHREELIIPFAHPAPRTLAVDAIRSTLVTSSLAALRERGHYERYLAALPLEMHEPVLSSIAGQWLPIGLGAAHYEACDALRLPAEEQEAIGSDVAARVQGTFLGTLVRAARGAGVTPWLGFKQYSRLWARLFRGGDVAVYKTGPKDARLEVVGLPLSRFTYFRAGFRGVNRATCALFAGTVYVHDVPRLCTDTTLGFRMSWA
jgi:hypothetical protein